MQNKFETYASYTEEDYLEDQDFRHWVLQPNPEAEEWWQELFARYPRQKDIAMQSRILLLEMKDHFQEEALKDQALDESFIAKLKEQMVPEKSTKVVRISRRRFVRYGTVAASIVFLLGVCWLTLIQPTWNTQTIATDYGEWKTYTLPDGSDVKLNANSEIQFAKSWEKGTNRKIWLKGEAFFEVKKDPYGATFTVITEDLEVEALGTAFNVHSRGGQTGIFLQEGKVRLDMGEEEKIMIPGEYISYSTLQHKIVEHKEVASATLASWKEGSLILQDETVAQILNKIEEIYGYEVIINRQELLDKQKTIAIPMDEIKVAIPILEKILGVEIQLENNQLIVE